MTIAEKNVRRKERLDDLQSRIRAILEARPGPLGLDEIVYYLQKARLDHDKDAFLDADNTFDVRDAISELVRAGVAREVVGRDVELNRG